MHFHVFLIIKIQFKYSWMWEKIKIHIAIRQVHIRTTTVLCDTETEEKRRASGWLFIFLRKWQIESFWVRLVTNSHASSSSALRFLSEVCRRSSEIKWGAFNCLLSLMKSNVVVQRVASVPPILPPLIASLSFSGLLGTTIKTMRWRWWHGQAGRINWMKAINCGTN